MIDVACQPRSYASVWKSFAEKLMRTHVIKRKSQIYDVVADVFSQDIPKVAVTVDYEHPVLDYVSDYWCGAPPDERVYENPYNAENYQWEVFTRCWNRFQNMCKDKTQEELQSMRDTREENIRREKKEYGSRKRRRHDY